ncbi:formate dehydrogenase subunit gamma [Photobacterium kishitanii]|uniref:Formate dehydrogenase subunit gamma n=2 Tax=Photobacterium kishitanii TaxID=318456 RepID=A0AAX0YWZ6_9GAMM|nr:formate dehydrogenase subunit gamma [Photobacterium kishitanii]PSV04743.1 formate dehydrogenase subunit gamma [Photobacterium kishitanii]PSV77834.1 formate dehydrogenase subunit gamma [Photobacterium kishitanii]PSW50448.1 formate dehydrogenase subunit gamma [Photobacterium kishitanii]PSW61989.1 formate dehydrogenase subunit gamma [Photobacterium kishitanii]
MTKRIQRWLTIMVTALIMAFSVSTMASGSDAKTAGEAVVKKEVIGFAGADYWRMVKDGEKGYTTSGWPEHDVLISVPGQTWYILKEKWMSPLGALAIFGSLVMVTLAYVVIGPLKLSKPKTGRKIKRWSRIDRALHWSMAFTFLTLGFSGLTLVYGKHFIKPIVPTEIWGWIILAAKQYHNYMGPIFAILLLAVLVKWWRKSTFNKVDLEWFKKMGGMVGKHKGSHPSAGFSNGGEKVIFWLLIIFGFSIAASGFVLDFPIFDQTRRDMELSNLLHMLSALILICGFIFHIYIGLFGMEAGLDGMVTGEVDETWAREHHNLWFDEVKDLPENQPGYEPEKTVSDKPKPSVDS